MTRGAWIAIIFFLLAVLAGTAVVYRAPLMRFLQARQTPAPVATTTPQSQTTLWQTFATTTFSVQYPPDYLQNTAYAYDQFGPKKLINGVSFTIPPSMATGTNLSADTRISVEQLPRAKHCTGDIFINADVVAQSLTEGGAEYSLATTSGAAAGNFYEEAVYALATSTPCTAVRYYIHSTNIGNYPEGTVTAFDRTALLDAFDAIRQTLQLK